MYAEDTLPEDLATTYGLKSAYISLLNDDQRLRIFDLTARTARALHPWVAQYPLIRRVRVWPLCLSVAAAAPFCSIAQLLSMAKMIWVFTADDVFDCDFYAHHDYHTFTTAGR